MSRPVTDPGDANSGGDQPKTTMHVARAIDGDTTSLEWLVVRLSPLLRSHAAYRLGPVLRRHYDPDDLVNDAWIALLPKLRELADVHDRRRTPMLLRYLSSTVVLRIRYLARRHARQTDPGAPPVDGVDPAAGLADARSGAVTRAMRREERDRVREQLDELPPADREVLLLRGIEQLSAPATAAMLAISVDAVHKRYQRALARLRERLPESVFGELDD
ncbi:MAG: RNA polymerase sigma factor [Planctomycetes bacterium]|nr:RNA polymerase sigma factor [Planctomycetota bacterium]